MLGRSLTSTLLCSRPGGLTSSATREDTSVARTPPVGSYSWAGHLVSPAPVREPFRQSAVADRDRRRQTPLLDLAALSVQPLGRAEKLSGTLDLTGDNALTRMALSGEGSAIGLLGGGVSAGFPDSAPWRTVWSAPGLDLNVEPALAIAAPASGTSHCFLEPLNEIGACPGTVLGTEYPSARPMRSPHI